MLFIKMNYILQHYLRCSEKTITIFYVYSDYFGSISVGAVFLYVIKVAFEDISSREEGEQCPVIKTGVCLFDAGGLKRTQQVSRYPHLLPF